MRSLKILYESFIYQTYARSHPCLSQVFQFHPIPPHHRCNCWLVLYPRSQINLFLNSHPQCTGLFLPSFLRILTLWVISWNSSCLVRFLWFLRILLCQFHLNPVWITAVFPHLVYNQTILCSRRPLRGSQRSIDAQESIGWLSFSFEVTARNS